MTGNHETASEKNICSCFVFFPTIPEFSGPVEEGQRTLGGETLEGSVFVMVRKCPTSLEIPFPARGVIFYTYVEVWGVRATFEKMLHCCVVDADIDRVEEQTKWRVRRGGSSITGPCLR